MTSQKSALLVSSCWWPFTARIALRFATMGWRVEAICPADHPLRQTRAVARAHRYGALRPASSLLAAIRAARPHVILPCDDRAVRHLHEIHARGDAGSAFDALMARSIGPVKSYAATEQRSELIRIAREEGLHAPETRIVASAAEVDAAIERLGFPVVLKADGTWGGNGVKVAHTQAQAQAMFAKLARPLAMAETIKRLLVHGEHHTLLPWLTGAKPQVNMQRFVHGRPANSAAACQDGEVLASTHAAVLHADQDVGPAQTVRLISHPDMQAATDKLVRRLELSGFCGFDFVIEAATGQAHLIEMNPRVTPICHLALGTGRDLVAALVSRLEGGPAPASAPVTDSEVITFFPPPTQFAPHSANPDDAGLDTGYLDAPWDDPGLMRALTQRPYHHRGILGPLFMRPKTPIPQGATALTRAETPAKDGFSSVTIPSQR